MRLLLPFLALAAAAADYPTLEIASRDLRAVLTPPDPARGYYRGTRFDWSGAILSLRYAGHEYFGQWFEKYDPTTHDAIAGPVEEFGPLGYDEAAPGGTFLRIGVGAVRKPEARPYQTFRTYEIVDHGRWKVKAKRNAVTFTHQLAANGYAYRYTKVLRLTPGKPELVIEHTLRNTGEKPIQTTQYNHNFFVIDGKPTGPASVVGFPFELQPKRDLKDLAAARGRDLRYLRELRPGESVYSELEGFGPTAADYDITIRNTAAGAGVRIRGDRPIARLVYWSIRTTTCPEPYVAIDVPPGRETRWRYTYTFFTEPPQP